MFKGETKIFDQKILGTKRPLKKETDDGGRLVAEPRDKRNSREKFGGILPRRTEPPDFLLSPIALLAVAVAAAAYSWWRGQERRGEERWVGREMERKVVAVCAVVGFLGVLSAALGFAAEATRVKVRLASPPPSLPPPTRRRPVLARRTARAF